MAPRPAEERRYTAEKQNLNKLMGTVNDIIGTIDLTNGSDQAVLDFKDVRDDLQEQLVEFCKTVDALHDLSATNDDVKTNYEASIDENIKIQVNARKTLHKLGNRIDLILQKRKEQLEGQRLITQPVPSANTNNNAKVSINLPKLDLPVFSGDILCWDEFWDTFESNIHSNTSLKPVEKFSYLKTNLRDEASACIAGLKVTNDNYDIAITLLKDRYENKEAISESLHNHYREYRPSSNRTADLRMLLDATEKYLRSLETIGENTDGYIFVALIKSKIPGQVKIQLEQSNEGNKWTLDLLRNKLKQHIVSRERAEVELLPSNAKHTSQLQTRFEPHKQPLKPTTDSFVANTGGSRFSPSQKCDFCDGRHLSKFCEKFPNQKTRLEQLRIKGARCLFCFSPDHWAHDCWRGRDKSCELCDKKGHHNSLCYRLSVPKAKGNGNTSSHLSSESESLLMAPDDEFQHEPAVDIAAEDSNTGEVGSTLGLLASGGQVLLQTATVTIQNRISHKMATTRILLDSGSQRTYVTEKLANHLNLERKQPENLTVNAFGGGNGKNHRVFEAELDVFLKDGSVKHLMVTIIPEITADVHRAAVDVTQLRNLPIPIIQSLADSLPAKSETVSIDMLLGNDYYVGLLTGQIHEIAVDYHALGTRLGWVLAGKVPGKKPSKVSSFLVTHNSKVDELFPSINLLSNAMPAIPDFNLFWKLETIGIYDNPIKTDDEKVLNLFNDSVKFSDGRYQVTWPWRELNPQLPTNRELALGRFNSLCKRLSKDPDLMSKYNDIIQDQLKKGIIERVGTESVEEGHLEHYIPHHAVVTPLKQTTKVRIVYDASAKLKKTSLSLNDCLLRGPVILEDLCGLLLRFRMHRVGLTADIEKAFLQIGLQPHDRDVTRFFWVKNLGQKVDIENTQIYRFARVPFGMISSPFLLAAAVSHHLTQAGDEIAHDIRKNMYVDNVITGTETTEKAISYYNYAKGLLQQASMNLREWSSNSKEFMNAIPEQDKGKGQLVKVLGLSWNITTDTLSVNGSEFEKVSVAKTKRQVLKAIMGIFDPLGLFSPVILGGKCFLKTLWEEKMDWDKPLSVPQLKEWEDISIKLQPISSFEFPRFLDVGYSPEDEIQLLCFCDASKHSYATTVYLRNDTTGLTQLIFCKNRLSPQQEITLPRLELLGVLIGIRALSFVQKHLGIEICQKFLWTDSLCVLSWLKSTKSLSVFVENRLKEIKCVSDVTFAYVSTHDNPADIATRSKSFADICNCDSWWYGPSWLRQPIANWPTWGIPELTSDMVREMNSEVKKTSAIFELSSVAGEDLWIENESSVFHIDVRRFSSLSKLLRVTGWCIRFVNSLKGMKPGSKHLTSNELNDAKIRWELYIQEKGYSEVISAIKHNKNHPLRNELGLQIDNKGLVRCHGRLSNSELPYDTKFPKLMPRNDYFTRLAIMAAHKKNLHSGVSHTLSTVRSEYWIPQGRVEISQVIRECLICRKADGGPYSMPPMPPFPKERVSASAPFTHTGLDYLGPLYTKTDAGQTKVWICLFTCFSVRAIHLEVVSDMSAEQFLLCLRRFFARRGRPQSITSDNATQFKVTKQTMEKLWEKILVNEDVQTYISNQGIKWTFITELAPWMGGFYERLVQNVKRALRKSIGSICLNHDQLTTIVAEAESVINSRPLTFVGTDFESGHALTPSHFLCLNPQTGIPNTTMKIDEGETCVAKNLLSIWKRGQKLLNSFWTVWQNEYLLSLRERKQTNLRQKRVQAKKQPSTGDVVLIKDNLLSRGSWRLARITELILGRDNKVRSVRLLLPSKREMTRALNMVYPLECFNSD